MARKNSRFSIFVHDKIIKKKKRLKWEEKADDALTHENCS